MKRFIFILLAIISVSVSFPQIAEASNPSTADVTQINRIITGTVVDEVGEPVAGVSIVVYNRNGGSKVAATQTDIDGKFSLIIPAVLPAEAIIQFSYVGHNSLTIKITELPSDNLTIVVSSDSIYIK